MKISVIILNWNRPSDTIKAVDSVLGQDYANFDVLVWDNASSDDSKSVLQARFSQNSRVRLFFTDANYGVAGGRNRAARETTGDVIFFLDSDAVIQPPTALSRVAERMGKEPGLGALSFETVRPDGFLMWPFARPSGEWRHKEFESARVNGCAFAIQRAAFDRAGGFAEHFSPYGAEDLHFSYKLIDCGYRIHYFPAVAAVHAYSSTGRTGIQFTMHVRNMLLIPMELFPFPHALGSFIKTAASLAKEASEQHQQRDYAKGFWKALTEFSLNERIPMSRSRWLHIRDIVKEEKRLARHKLDESVSG